MKYFKDELDKHNTFLQEQEKEAPKKGIFKFFQQGSLYQYSVYLALFNIVLSSVFLLSSKYYYTQKVYDLSGFQVSYSMDYSIKRVNNILVLNTTATDEIYISLSKDYYEPSLGPITVTYDLFNKPIKAQWQIENEYKTFYCASAEIFKYLLYFGTIICIIFVVFKPKHSTNFKYNMYFTFLITFVSVLGYFFNFKLMM